MKLPPALSGLIAGALLVNLFLVACVLGKLLALGW